jgi:uncharacterized protein involved in exopolysaccharide biosynthesis
MPGGCVQASQARRQVASRIALMVRHHGPDAPGLPALRRQLDALRVAEIAEWAAAAQADLPGTAEVARARREARRVLGAGGEAA